jgi:hypothetical protein
LTCCEPTVGGHPPATGGGAASVARTVRVLATRNVDIATQLEAGDIVDGVVLAVGDLVLCAYQTDQTQNGIYTVPVSGAASRASWADSADDLPWGLAVRVLAGDYGAGLVYVLQSHAPTIGVDAIVWQEPDPIRDGGRFYGGIDQITNANAVDSQRWGWATFGSVAFNTAGPKDGGMLPPQVSVSNATASSSTHTRTSSWALLGGITIREKFRFALTAVSDGVDNYSVAAGLGDSTAADMTDGIYFVHTSGNANWVARTSQAGVRTSVVTTTPVVGANTFVDFEIRANATSARYFINRSLVATITTNLPTANTTDFGLRFTMNRISATITTRSLNLSYVHALCSWTPPRIAP